MKEHLNYSRQLAKKIMSMLAIPSLDPETQKLISSVVDLHGTSTKFILPDGGRLYDDIEFKALDESVPLRLPYPSLCLEYHSGLEYHSDGKDWATDKLIGFKNGVPQYQQESCVESPKRVVYAQESKDYIMITIAFWTPKDGQWRILPECAIPVTGYLNREILISGRVGIQIVLQNPRVPLSDYMDEIGALLCFLNVLQCSNVCVERSEPKNFGKQIKSALPFDVYHILTINANQTPQGIGSTGGHRSPREHLRRGHIRRLSDARRIWVNATVVAAGRNAGKVTKNYLLGES